MGCYNPIKGYMRQDAFGRKFTMNNGSTDRSKADYTPQTVPCGQCVGCRLDRSRSWAIRCMHESSLYTQNCFITLTYAPEHLPANGSLVYEHFQKFMKRLRFAYRGCDPVTDTKYDFDLDCDVEFTHWPIRFYMAGEYGENFGRPHFHAILFNFDFPDKRPFKKTPSGKMIYTSKILQELWPYGFSSIGEANFQSAAYVSRYIMKKITGAAADTHYETIDADGVVDYRVPEFNKMSLKPGIGANWFKKYQSDVFPHDHVIVNGKPQKPPRYYDNLYLKNTGYYSEKYGRILSASMEEIQFIRHETALQRLDDNTPDRLKVKESIAISRLDKLKRKLI